MKMIFNGVVLYLCIRLSGAIVFDYYTGEIASKELQDYYKDKGILDVCTIDIEPCCATERKRLDGSCNNIDHPAKGTNFMPLIRLLPALYYNGSYSKKAVSGEDLLWPRIIRRTLLTEGKRSDCDFTQMMTSFGIFMFGDIGSTHDIHYFLQNKTDCCTTGRNDYKCIPNLIPQDDSLHRLSGIDCLNLTRPLTHQHFGCTNDSIPSPFAKATSAFDLSQVYNHLKRIRTYVDGQLIMEVENGKTWPQKGQNYCPLNEANETRCFANHPNMLMPVTVFVVWFMRLHNYFATQLAIINPCWDDDTLFYVARDMNIACAMQMLLYEWLASLEGYKNLVKAGVISKKCVFRDIYNHKKYPATTLEYTYVLRWFHTAQEATAKMYDVDGTYLRDYPMFNLTFRPGYLVKDKHMEYLTQGHFRQPCGKIDHSIDYEVADHGLPGIQRAVDIATSDLHKGRLFGLRPYIDYLYYCTGHKITCFDDLLEHVDAEKICELKKVYADVGDIELMSGMYVEKLVHGGKIPRTVACLLNDNILKAIKGDRHWYERPNRPYAFTEEQLKEIRKASLAWLLCKVGDGVTEIQKKAFLNISPKNPLVKCCDLPDIDIKAWADPECSTDNDDGCKKDDINH